MKITIKKLLFIFTIFTILFFANNVFAFNPTFYVGDGVTGVATQCQDPNYNTITEALDYIYTNDISNSIIMVCEGTYDENIPLIGDLGISIIGENNNVNIEYTANNTNVFSFFPTSSNFYLKNLNLKSYGFNVIGGYLVDGLTLEDLEITIEDNSSLDNNVTGILLSNSNNINFKGNITINGISSDKDKIVGIEISNSQDVVFDTDSEVFVKDIYSTNNNSQSYGLNISNSTVDFKGDVKVDTMNGLASTGMLVDNSNINGTAESSITIEKIDSMSVVKGIEIINDSVVNLNPNMELVFSDLDYGNAEVYGLLLKDIVLPTIGNSSFYNLGGDFVTNGLYLENVDAFFLNKVYFSENKTSDQSHFLTFINSKGLVSNIEDIEETINSADLFKFVYIKDNSDIVINDFAVYSGDPFPECIWVEGNSVVEINNGNFNGCLDGSIKNKDSQLIIKSPTSFNETKLISFQSNSSSLEVYKPINLSFLKEGSSFDVNSILFYNEDGYVSNLSFNNNSEIDLDLLYYKISFEDNVVDVKTYSDYGLKVVFDNINEALHPIVLHNYEEENYQINLEEMPSEFLEMRANDEGTIKSSNHFSVIEKECSVIEKNTYKCYDIEKSLSINGSDYELDFTVPVSWIVANELEGNNINLYHYENGSYTKLDTTKKELIDNNQKYTAIINSFSEFKIGGEEDSSSSDSGSPDDSSDDTSNDTPNDTPNDLTDDLDTNEGIEDTNDLITDTNEDVEDTNDDLDGFVTDTNNLDNNSDCYLRCGPGYRLDRNNCECVQIVLEGVKTGEKFFNMIFYLILIVIIVVLSIFLINNKRSKKKFKKDKSKKDKFNTNRNNNNNKPKKIKSKKANKVKSKSRKK